MPFSHSQHLEKGRKLETLVENRTRYALTHSELNLFETHQSAESVKLQFSEPTLASMIMGKKVMHLRDEAGFDFFPGESVILPADELMCIDFPEATRQRPTKCLALTLSEEFIQDVCHSLNQHQQRLDGDEWHFTRDNFHFTNDRAIHQIIDRLIFLFAENHPSKDLFADMMLRELVIRLMQTDIRYSMEKGVKETTGSRLQFILGYIRQHLDEDLSVEALSQKAYMSTSHFHRSFKSELGLSPVEYIHQERISKACQLLRSTELPIREIGLRCGFNHLSYFNRLFKRYTKCTPGAYRKKG